jgi:hypothetical protein
MVLSGLSFVVVVVVETSSAAQAGPELMIFLL